MNLLKYHAESMEPMFWDLPNLMPLAIIRFQDTDPYAHSLAFYTAKLSLATKIATNIVSKISHLKKLRR